MLNKIKQILGMGKAVDYAELVKQGAIILDVRSTAEYAGGHIKGSINIPLPVLAGNLAKLTPGKAIITCCASGMRSASARTILKSNGFMDVHNGGGWSSLQHKI